MCVYMCHRMYRFLNQYKLSIDIAVEKYFWSPSIYLSSGQTIHSLLLSICSLFIHKLKIFSKTRTKMFSHIIENIFIRLCIKLCCLENWWSCFLSAIGVTNFSPPLPPRNHSSDESFQGEGQTSVDHEMMYLEYFWTTKQRAVPITITNHPPINQLRILHKLVLIQSNSKIAAFRRDIYILIIYYKSQYN